MNKNTPRVVWFEEVDKTSIPLVGGKGANLGEMLTAKLPIPYGFIITSAAYFDFVEYNNLAQAIKEATVDLDYNNQDQLSKVSKKIRASFEKGLLPDALRNRIVDFYENLYLRELRLRKGHSASSMQKLSEKLRSNTLVAVRSSATAEDLPEASFAGQQETFLNISGENTLLNTVRSCFASLFTERAMYYRHENNFDHLSVGLAVVVQKMVQSDRSGIAFSIDPVTNDKSKLVIEAVFGLGEFIVQGRVTPDHYEVQKSDLTILQKKIVTQTEAMVRHGADNIAKKLDKEQGSKTKLDDEEVVEIAKVVQMVEAHYDKPQDIEWAIEDDLLFVVQSRPITTTGNNTTQMSGAIRPQAQALLTGDPASPGVGVGKPVIIKNPSQNNLLKSGNVMVANQTNPDFVPAMKRAGAIITQKGGRTSHAAIVAREFGIPAVVGVENAIKEVHDLYEVTVDGSTGNIYAGNQKQSSKPVIKHSKEVNHNLLIKIYLNLAEPDLLAKYSDLPVDGVGLLRAEFLLAQFGHHPQALINAGKREDYIKFLSNNLNKFAKHFDKKPVVYRTTDFKTNEYASLKGGEKLEETEENPLLGFRGTSRYLVNHQAFEAEIEAFLRSFKMYPNLVLMLPFIRTPMELIDIRQKLIEFGFFDFPTPPKLWIMVEVPSTVLLLETFLNLGVDGVSIGTNDLTMLTLGVDRDNAKVAKYYQETNRAVMWMLEQIVTTCARKGVTCSLCGQAASDYPEIVKKLVDWGITSVSVSPDAVEKTIENIQKFSK